VTQNCAQLNEQPSPDISKALAPVKSTDVAVMVSRTVIEWPQAGLSLQINKGSQISSAPQSHANGSKQGLPNRDWLNLPTNPMEASNILQSCEQCKGKLRRPDFQIAARTIQGHPRGRRSVRRRRGRRRAPRDPPTGSPPAQVSSTMGLAGDPSPAGALEASASGASASASPGVLTSAPGGRRVLLNQMPQ
jgi:hypothetical protein